MSILKINRSKEPLIQNPAKLGKKTRFHETKQQRILTKRYQHRLNDLNVILQWEMSRKRQKRSEWTK